VSILVILVPLALFLGLCGLFAFVWSTRSGQFDDLEGAAARILSDEDLRDPERLADRPDAHRTEVDTLGK
jgi:cbb3-type cytochrome oxidase maturation protein